MGYLIAAYGIVIGALAGYGLWLHARRRELMRDAGLHGNPGTDEPRAG